MNLIELLVEAGSIFVDYVKEFKSTKYAVEHGNLLLKGAQFA